MLQCARPAMQEESVREIQLNGKQLVFLFMTATAAAVVIFLCGVMVGRGVSAPPALSGNSTTTPLDPTAEVIYGTEPAAGSPAELLAQFEEPPIDVSDAEPAPVRRDSVVSEPVPEPVPLPEQLAESTPPAASPAESGPTRSQADSRPAESRPAESARSESAPPESRKVESPAAEPPASARAAAPVAQAEEHPTEGYVVQVAAVRARSQADSIVADLTSKGFRAFVSSPETGAPFFRVRIGRFQDRREAERVASRLEAEEQLTPWVTR